MLSLTFGVRLRYFIARLFSVDIALFTRLHILRKTMPFLILLLLLMAKTQFLSAQAVTVSTLAGSGVAGFANGAAVTAQFFSPGDVCSDAAGNIYVADANNNRIRKIDASGNVTTYAGNGTAGFANGAAATAQFFGPAGVCSDAAGNIYVADPFNSRIRKIDASGNVTTYAGSGIAGFANGAAATAQFSLPTGVCSDAAGNIYVADNVDHRIRKIDASGNVTTYAGNGTAGFADGAAATAQFFSPIGVCSDAAGNIYVADRNNRRIRKIDGSGNVTTYAGSGTAGFANGAAATAQFNIPTRVCSDAAGNIYVADFANNRIRKIDGSGNVTTYAGSGTAGSANGVAAIAQFNSPVGVCFDVAGNINVADQGNHRICKISPLFQGITSFSPTSGSAGTSVVITGSGFTGATAVSFGGTPASSFVVNSDTQITAVVGSSTAVTGGQQLVIITAPAGTFSLGGFSLGATAQSAGIAPTGNTAPQSAVISGFSPQSLALGTPITLSGSGFTGATGLLIGGVPVTNFVVVNDNTITAIVGGVPVNDRVQLTGGLGSSLDMSGLGLTYLRLPTPNIASIAPASLTASGDDASLTLTGFYLMAGARAQVSERGANGTFSQPTSIGVQSVNATQAVVTLSGIFRSPGVKMVTMVNPDGQTASVMLTVVTGAAVQLSSNNGQPFVFTTTASGRAFSVRLSGANIFRTVQAFVGNLQARVTVPSSTEAIVEVPASVNEFGGTSLTLRLTNTDGQSTTATLRIERRPPPTIIGVTLQTDGRLRVRGVNFLVGIRAALSNSVLTVLSQETDVEFVAQIPPSFRLSANTPTVSLTVENPDGRSHGVLLPRSLFDGQVASASVGNAVTTERTWENSSVTAALVEVVARKQEQSASQELSIYPNPMETELRISGAGQRTVRVYDMRGGVVLEERITSGSVNVSSLPMGAYTVVVEAADGQIVRQRVVKK